MIFYTTDGTTPTTNATVYTGPFTLPTSATISAVAFQTGAAPSALATSATATASFRVQPRQPSAVNRLHRVASVPLFDVVNF